MIPTLQLGQTGLALPRGLRKGWTPAELASPPAIWWGIDSPMTATGAGPYCDQWNDLSGNGYHAVGGSPGSPIEPTVVLADSTLSNLRTVNSDGVNDVLFTTAAGAKDIYNNATSAWVAMVHRRVAVNTGLRYIFYTGANASGSTRFAITGANTANKPGIRARRLDADAVAQLDAGTANDAAWHMWLFTVELSTRTATIHRDDVQDAQNTTFTSAGSNFSPTTANEAVGLFARPSAAGPSAEHLSEIMCGTGIPTAAERRKIFGYFAWRKGLVSQLPSDSPYLLAPP